MESKYRIISCNLDRGDNSVKNVTWSCVHISHSRGSFRDRMFPLKRLFVRQTFELARPGAVGHGTARARVHVYNQGLKVGPLYSCACMMCLSFVCACACACMCACACVRVCVSLAYYIVEHTKEKKKVKHLQVLISL